LELARVVCGERSGVCAKFSRDRIKRERERERERGEKRTFGVFRTLRALSERVSFEVDVELRLSSLILREGLSRSRKFRLKSGMCMAGSLAIMSFLTEREPVLKVKVDSVATVVVVVEVTVVSVATVVTDSVVAVNVRERLIGTERRLLFSIPSIFALLR